MKTFKMKKVLIAVDYDPAAQKVAETGYSLAEKIDAEVVLLHVISEANPEYYFAIDYSPIMGYNGFNETGPWQLNNIDTLKGAALQFLDKIKEHLGDDKIHSLVETGNIADTIISTAKKVNADVIVMGTHGRSKLDELLLGSATERVLRHSSIPLFIVPTKQKK